MKMVKVGASENKAAPGWKISSSLYDSRRKWIVSVDIDGEQIVDYNRLAD